MEIVFKADKKHRDMVFTSNHFAHPAKMMLPLQRWIIDRYTKPGDVILDPMGGCGTVLVATQTGRHVILVELEAKFITMIEDNWAKIQTIGPEMGYDMGTAQIIQGDGRNLEVTFGNLKYGDIDCVISSPPYEGSDVSQTHMTSNERGDPKNPNYRPSWKRKLAEGYADTKRPYADTIITSPPYEGTTGEGKEIGSQGHAVGAFHYGNDEKQIGNLKGQTYLEAMLQVYTQCHKVLKRQALMILVTKNFIRDKQEVRLDEDTIKLCQEAGFEFIERHYRKLTSQSFWRVIYKQKYPDAPEIGREDILVFSKV